jgi:5-methylthioadenosine/S-adenosylhomocysteine deaminase
MKSKSVFWLSLLVCLLVAPLPAASLLVRNATIVTLEADQPDPFTGYMLVDAEGRIAAIGAGDPPAGAKADSVIDARGKIVMPGFLSGHSHLWQSAYRGIAADQWVIEWVQRIHRTYGPHFVAGDLYAYTLHGALDYLRHGITTTYNYSQNLGFAPAMYEEQFQAQLDAGARFIFGYALTPRPSIEATKANFEAFYTKVKAMAPNPLLLGIGLASAGVDTGAEYTQFEFDLARQHNLIVSMHYLEAPTAGERQRANFANIEKANGLGPKLNYAHFIQTDEAIIAKSGAAGAGMIWNPLSNGRLASGLADIPAILKSGMKVGMGIDGQASADISDPFENMRMGLYGLRMKHKDPLVMQPIDVLRLHTIGTAAVFGVDDQVGTLKAGKYADFLVVDPSEMDVGPVFDVYATLVFSCSLANLEKVYVGGKLVVERGNPLEHDIAKIAASVKTRVAAGKARKEAAMPVKP